MNEMEYSEYLQDILNIKGMDEESAQKVIEMLDAKRDHRSLDNTLFHDFIKKERALNEFFIKVESINKNSSVLENKLVVCFRGKKLKIYKNNHVLWDIEKKDNGYSIEFNFDHARYYKDWKKELSTLKGYGFDVNYSEKEKERFIDYETGLKAKYRKDTDLVTGGTIGTIRCIKEKFSEEFVKNTYEIFSELIGSFMKGGDDQFRNRIRELHKGNPNSFNLAEDIRETGTNPYIEKRWQQRLFIHYKEKEKGKPFVFAYDLEFSQRYPEKTIKDMMVANEPDLMAIQFDDDGIAQKLLLIEVKSTYAACWNEKKNKETGIIEHQSDLWEHVKGMKAYSDMSFFIRSRIEDAYEIIKQYSETELYPAIKYIQMSSILSLTDKDVRRIILLTNNKLQDTEEQVKNKREKVKSALDFLNDKKMNKELAELLKDEDKECEIWFTEDNYFSKDLKIKQFQFCK